MLTMVVGRCSLLGVMNIKPMHDEAYILRAQMDDEVLGEFVAVNSRFIHSSIWKVLVKIQYRDLFLCSRGIGMDDLYQEACIAFIRAVRTYRPGRGAKLTTYARLLIGREIQRVLEWNEPGGMHAGVRYIAAHGHPAVSSLDDLVERKKVVV